MDYDNEVEFSHSKSQAQWWHMGLIWGFIFTLVIINFGCDDEPNPEESDEYYVKYEVNSSTIYYGGKLSVTINTEKGNTTFTINQRTLWETIIGPVQKGFDATLKVTAVGETHNKLTIYTNIYVSKNDSPFALKASDGSDTPRDFVQLNYKIDY